jgi:hypothetical protein
MRAKRKGNAMAMARDDEPHLALALVLYAIRYRRDKNGTKERKDRALSVNSV